MHGGGSSLAAYPTTYREEQGWGKQCRLSRIGVGEVASQHILLRVGKSRGGGSSVASAESVEGEEAFLPSLQTSPPASASGGHHSK